MRRLRPAASLIALVGFEAAALLVLRGAGHVEVWRVDWQHFGRWLDATPIEDVVAGLARWAGLVIVVWLCVTTTLYLLATVCRVPGLMRATGVFTLPGVRRIVEGTVAVSMMATALASRVGPAVAQEPAGGWAKHPTAATAAQPPPPTFTAFVRVELPPDVPHAIEPTATDAGGWVVAPGDNFWDIAAADVAHQRSVPVDTLRAADIVERWREIIEASESAGGVPSGDPNLIYPGAVAVLPLTRDTAPAAAAAPAARVLPPAPAAPGTSAAPTAAPSTDVPTAVPAPAAPTTAVPTTAAAPTIAAATTAPPPTTTAAPSVALPVPDPPQLRRPVSSPTSTTVTSESGAEVAAPPGPPVPAPPSSLGRQRAPVTTVPADPLQRGTAPAAAPDAPADSPAEETTDTASSRSPASRLPLVGGLLAAGLVGVLEALRRLQRNHRRPGRRTRLPEGELAEVEMALRARATPADAEALDIALRLWAVGVREEALPVPEVLGVELTRSEVEFVLAEPATPAPDGFHIRDSGTRWVCPRRGLEAYRHLCEDERAPLPALVNVGHTQRGQVLLNLEAAGVVAIAGDRIAIEGVLAAMALGLASSRWTDYVDVELVGLDDLEGEHHALERIRHASSLPALRLDDAAREAEEMCEESGFASTTGGRIMGVLTGDWMSVTVAISAQPLPEGADALVEALVEARGRCGQILVVAGDVPGAQWELDVSEDGVLRIPPLGIAVEAEMILSAEMVEEVAPLLDVVADVEDVAAPAAAPGAWVDPVALDDEDIADGQVDVDETWEGAGFEEDDEAELELLILGPPAVRVRGPGGEWKEVDFERPKDLELVLLLGELGPQGAPMERIMARLWPTSEDVKPKTLENVVGRARRALGRASDGTEFLPKVRPGGRTYKLKLDKTRCDFWTFQALVDHAKSTRSPAARIEALRVALELVRGRPYDAPGGYEWVNGQRTTIADTVTDGARELADLYLRQEDPEQARWAARRGRAVDPYIDNEMLGRCEMGAADLDGDLGKVRAIYRRLKDDVGPDNTLHPETEELYQRLTGLG